MRVRSLGAVRVLVCVLSIIACKGSEKGITLPNPAKPCGASGTVQLSSLHALTVACTAGTTVTLAGGGASYLIVPNLATGSAANQRNAYTIGIVSGVSSDLAPAVGPSLDLPPTVVGEMPAGVRRQIRQRAFDAATELSPTRSTTSASGSTPPTIHGWPMCACCGSAA